MITAKLRERAEEIFGKIGDVMTYLGPLLDQAEQEETDLRHKLTILRDQIQQLHVDLDQEGSPLAGTALAISGDLSSHLLDGPRLVDPVAWEKATRDSPSRRDESKRSGSRYFGTRPDGNFED